MGNQTEERILNREIKYALEEQKAMTAFQEKRNKQINQLKNLRKNQFLEQQKFLSQPFIRDCQNPPPEHLSNEIYIQLRESENLKDQEVKQLQLQRERQRQGELEIERRRQLYLQQQEELKQLLQQQQDQHQEQQQQPQNVILNIVSSSEKHFEKEFKSGTSEIIVQRQLKYQRWEEEQKEHADQEKKQELQSKLKEQRTSYLEQQKDLEQYRLEVSQPQYEWNQFSSDHEEEYNDHLLYCDSPSCDSPSPGEFVINRELQHQDAQLKQQQMQQTKLQEKLQLELMKQKRSYKLQQLNLTRMQSV